MFFDATKTATVNATAAIFASQVTDEITLPTALALWPLCDQLVGDVCCIGESELMHDTAMRVRIVCERILRAADWGKLEGEIVWKAGKLSRECTGIMAEAMEMALSA